MSDEDVDLQSWGWTDLSSYSSAASDSEKERRIVSCPQTRTMSRRSLRLDDGLLDRGLPHSSASFSVGGGGWRSTRSLKSRRSQQHSVSCSESVLVHTPRRPVGHSLHDGSVHSVASDASLLSSLLDESSIQEATLVDTFWGLDHDPDPKESTIIAEQSTVLANSTLIGSDSRCAKHPGQTLRRVYCKDCELLSDRKESVSTNRSSSKHTPCSSTTGPGPSDHGEAGTSTVYCRDRNRKSRTDVLQLWLDGSVLCVRRAAARCGSVLTRTWRVCRGRASQVTEGDMRTDTGHGARSSHCRVMDLTESTTNLKELHPSGSLCKTAGEAFRWLSRRWHHMTTSFVLTRFPLRLLLVLLPLLLLLMNITGWRTAASDVPSLSSIYVSMSSQSQSPEAEEESREQVHVAPPYSRPPAEEGESAVEESARLVRLEQSLTALWKRVEAGGREAEQRHGEVLRLYTDLQQQPAAQSGEEGVEGVEPWLSGLLDHQLSRLRRRLDEERRQREQIRQQGLLQQQRQASRLAQLELQLQTLAAQTQEVQWRRDAATAAAAATLPAAVSAGVDRQAHDALLAQVARLEATLEDVRRDVEGLSGSEDGCQRLDRIQQTISVQVTTQVREEVRALVYGDQLAVGGGDSDTLPASLLQRLSQQYVSGADLQVALASLELRILQNISLQLERRRGEEMVRDAVLQTAGAAGATVTQEDVRVIVASAVRLFSQDRTGRADYALESGGGSILSTRCSETYETKAALLSLFGVPLWYFSQSPRVVIQPDIQPGNCWAFRGSTGFLVIRLSMRILPTAFSLEHLPKALAPSGTLRSAPRDFSVYGLDDESQERGKLLGSYTYAEAGEALQTYPVAERNDETFQIIEVQVLSNWGHEEYTCMYRFRVHGTPSGV